jgi:hypothetical protein
VVLAGAVLLRLVARPCSLVGLLLLIPLPQLLRLRLLLLPLLAGSRMTAALSLRAGWIVSKVI